MTVRACSKVKEVQEKSASTPAKPELKMLQLQAAMALKLIRRLARGSRKWKMQFKYTLSSRRI